MFVCLGITGLLGSGLFMTVYRMSDTYGQYGLIKKMAKHNLPVFLKASSRKLFLKLKTSASKNSTETICLLLFVNCQLNVSAYYLLPTAYFL